MHIPDFKRLYMCRNSVLNSRIFAGFLVEDYCEYADNNKILFTSQQTKLQIKVLLESKELDKQPYMNTV